VARIVGCLVAAGLAAVAAEVLVADPAAASTPESWPAVESMTVLRALLIFAGIPLALTVLIVVFTLIPTILRGPEQSQGQRWAEPQWFGGPVALDSGTSSPGSGATAMSGSSAESRPASATGSTALTVRSSAPVARASESAGGAGARW